MFFRSKLSSVPTGVGNLLHRVEQQRAQERKRYSSSVLHSLSECKFAPVQTQGVDNSCHHDVPTTIVNTTTTTAPSTIPKAASSLDAANLALMVTFPRARPVSFPFLLPPKWTAAVPRDLQSAFGRETQIPSTAYVFQAFIHHSFLNVSQHQRATMMGTTSRSSTQEAADSEAAAESLVGTMGELAPLGLQLLRLSLTNWFRNHRHYNSISRSGGNVIVHDDTRYNAFQERALFERVLSEEGLAALVTTMCRVEHLILSGAGVLAIDRALSRGNDGGAVIPVHVSAMTACALVGAIYLSEGLPAATQFAVDHILSPRLYAVAVTE